MLFPGQDRPGDPDGLVGLGHSGDVGMPPGGHIHQPSAAIVGLVGGGAQHAAGAVHE